ncbi:MAG: hypothetical protein Q9184_007195, partial [Pyrenodesmia sp. 2 TL-2023]
MLSLVTTLFIFLSTFSHTFSQPLVQVPASPSTKLPVDSDLEQFAPVFGGLSLNDTSTQLRCFNNQPGFPRFLPTYRPDCFALIYTILLRPTAATPIRYDATTGVRPSVYRHGTCVISVYAA